MSEQNAEEFLPKPQPTRRELLTNILPKAATVGALTVGADIIAENEAEHLQEGGIDTPQGLFTGIYETHKDPLTKEKLPPGIDVLFREMTAPVDQVIADPEKYIKSHTKSFKSAFFPEDVLMDLAETQAFIMLGDIEFNVPRGLVDAASPGLASVLAGIELLNQRDTRKATKAKHVGRRRLLKAGLVGTAAWGLAPSATGLGAIATHISAKDTAIDNVARKLSDIATHAHPEDEMAFFRNVVMADKLLTVGEKFKEVYGKKPHIGFSVGVGHSGVEDLLQAGPDFCRALITAYPDFILRDLVDRNGGPEAFSSSMLYLLSPDITPDAIHTPGQKLNGNKAVITDTKLEEQLGKALSIKA